MRKVRDVLRLKHTLGMSLRQISEATGIGKTVIGEYVRRAGVLGITWPVPEEIDDADLSASSISRRMGIGRQRAPRTVGEVVMRTGSEPNPSKQHPVRSSMAR